MKRVIRLVLLGAVGSVSFGIVGDDALQAQAGPAERIPVVVELFTSEGCSSCPPADRLLSQLLREQPVPGVEIIALGEHVDYWDSLGWPDRFSSSTFTARQSKYQSRVFTDNVVYTPQAVVDGVVEAIGSDSAAVRRAVQRAAQRTKIAVRMNLVALNGGAAVVHVAVDGSALTSPADVVLVAVEDDLATAVARGENRGRTLRHDAVVRHIEPIGRLDGRGSQFELEHRLPIGADWRTDELRVVALVQARESWAILGAASVSVAPR